MAEIRLALWNALRAEKRTCCRCKNVEPPKGQKYCTPCRQAIYQERKVKQALEFVIKHF